MLKSRRKTIQNKPASNAAQMMNLSLFIMLLAFFIVLNAISSFDTSKSDPIVSNLKMVFSTDVRHEDIRPSIRDNPVQSLHEGETVDRLEALFEAQITGFKATKNQAAKTLQVDVPLDSFSTSVMALNQKDLTVGRRASADGAFFLPTLVSILKSDETGVTYRMDMIFSVNGNPSILKNENPQPVRNMMRRGGQLVRKIEEAGLSQRLLSLGLHNGDPSVVTLLFRRHFAFDPTYGRNESLE